MFKNNDGPTLTNTKRFFKNRPHRTVGFFKNLYKFIRVFNNIHVLYMNKTGPLFCFVITSTFGIGLRTR